MHVIEYLRVSSDKQCKDGHTYIYSHCYIVAYLDDEATEVSMGRSAISMGKVFTIFEN